MLSIKERKLIIRWDKEGKGQEEIARLLKCNQSSVSRLLVKYKRRKIVTNLPRSGRPTRLTPSNLTKLKRRILSKIKAENTKYCSVSTKHVAQIIKQELGEQYSLRHVERILHKLGFSLITPRPEHLRHDQEKVDTFREEFKKNFKRSMWVMS